LNQKLFTFKVIYSVSMSRVGSRHLTDGMMIGILLICIGSLLGIMFITYERAVSPQGMINIAPLLCFPALMTIAGLMLFLNALSKHIKPQDHYLCIKCGRPLAWDGAVKRWFCLPCKIYY
jgi:hypothetical protein